MQGRSGQPPPFFSNCRPFSTELRCGFLPYPRIDCCYVRTTVRWVVTFQFLVAVPDNTRVFITETEQVFFCPLLCHFTWDIHRERVVRLLSLLLTCRRLLGCTAQQNQNFAGTWPLGQEEQNRSKDLGVLFPWKVVRKSIPRYTWTTLYLTRWHCTKFDARGLGPIRCSKNLENVRSPSIQYKNVTNLSLSHILLQGDDVEQCTLHHESRWVGKKVCRVFGEQAWL